MWTRLAHFVIKNRLVLVIVLGLITATMGYLGRNVTMTYDFTKVVPESDPDMVYFEEFKQLFGEDGNILAIGIKDSSLYTPTNFLRFKYLSDELAKLEGVNNVLSIPRIQRLKKNTEERKFQLDPFFADIPQDQSTLDSLLALVMEQRFYTGQLINPENGATLILVAINKEVLNSPDRQKLIEDIKYLGDRFAESTQIDVHYAGLPFVRSIMAGKVKKELNFFLVLSVIVTGIILLVFFRSWDAVVFPMLIIGVVVVWVVGTLGIFGFKITMLTGLIPPIIVVIGIPNSIYLINKYHQEFERHGNKMKAISTVTRKIGMVTLITNFTTAIGFLVLATTDIIILKEFGIVAGLNILATFIVSFILIPAVFSWLPSPSKQQMKHLSFKPMDKVLTTFDYWIHNRRRWIYSVTIVVVAVSVYGVMQLKTVSYIVDDIPEDTDIMRDMGFFESNFSGVMPLEVVVDTGKKRGVIRLSNLQKVQQLETFLDSIPEISKPVSLVSFIKAARQAYYNNNPAYYQLPNSMDYNFILQYFRDQSDSSGLLKAFVDSTGQKMRITLKMADIGSVEMDKLIRGTIQPRIDSLFADTEVTATVTGTSPLFVKGNRYLVQNLQMSLILAFIIIAIVMGILFVNLRVVLISLIPNIIPLLITAGLMGYFNIALKPSTSLIFCIAFGIAVDDAIHFLAKYRQELFAHNFFVPIAISRSLKETGTSMMYTSIVLFFGFVIFAGSDFGGTVALGVLTSTTLLIAMFTNLLLLPSLLLTFDDGKRRKDAHPLIEQYDEDFYHETDDEEIDLKRLEVQKQE
ncbi:efflux RND transporter permease subunit [Cytophagales bacterium LB-30]|uniref:Efflux RND transporter permease subunit n=1 Tax=Shiella aurantiaca TaxID=3058365 RepID=A0ABT8F611_9BACT|nr:efflux RND transporter permease subunit [Shiella aurantiaca]MDN4165799.1 efflux RND transporter permease subunit [Shiella aurantiaca]